MAQKLTGMTEGQKMADFILFDESYTIRAKIPCEVLMSSIDSKLPPSSVYDKSSAKAVRAYWNNKNLRKRSQ